MTIKTYHNGTILVPLKCGSRFMDGIFTTESGGYSLSELKRTLFIPKIQSIIVRPPIEHIHSALHTEIINAYNNTEKNPDEPIDIISIIDTFIYKGHHQEHQNIHWHRDLYEILYWLWRRNRNKIEIVKLNDLSSHLKSIGIKIPKYKKEDYNFSKFEYYCDVDELIMFIKNAFPNEYKNILSQIDQATKYYNYLINSEVIDISIV